MAMYEQNSELIALLTAIGSDEKLSQVAAHEVL
jgi:hypothetical protein